MKVLYNLGIFLYTCAIRIAALFNEKAAQWQRGRKHLWEELEQKLNGGTFRSAEERIWIHCASLGEFEQGRPLIERIRKEQPKAGILLTFFSPSGYEIRKNYPGVDIISYLPADFPGNARRFLDITVPTKVIFVKYEFWFNFLGELARRKIPHFLISGIFRTDQVFFKWYGGWFREFLKKYDRIFLQNDESASLLNTIGILSHEVSGDTRFDRVNTLAADPAGESVSEVFSKNRSVMVCGSTWPADEELLARWCETGDKKDFCLILAPHETGPAHLDGILRRFASLRPSLHSAVKNNSVPEDCRMLVIDHIGSLSKLYRYGHVCYVGGGFGSGIHNLLEAAVYGKPVFFGPQHHKFNEALELMRAGGGFCITDAKDLEMKINFLFSDPMLLRMASMTSREYVVRRTGATERLYTAIFTP
ncbi:MAG: 3-deoxy-D-manno-octulosonic acid transferase [Bacteroidia bacterium]|nr:3-deoxy-D-manno-octulosonic acid transferase [Bacteroidia bacterium]